MQAHTPPVRPRKWSDAERSKVKTMLARGASAGMVASEFNLSRNAALGRIFRDPDMALNHVPLSPIRPVRITPPRPKPALPVVNLAQSTSPRSVEPEPAYPLPLMGTGRRFCKWPILMTPKVVGGMLCCGEPCHPGSVYCAYHAVKARASP